jgi:hypothetical protein
MTKPKHWDSIKWVESIGGTEVPSGTPGVRAWVCGDVKFRLHNADRHQPWYVETHGSGDYRGFTKSAQQALANGIHHAETQLATTQRQLDALRAVAP